MVATSISRRFRLSLLGGSPFRPPRMMSTLRVASSSRDAGNRISRVRLPGFAGNARFRLAPRTARNRACNRSCSTRFRWQLNPPPSSRSRPAIQSGAAPARVAERRSIRNEREPPGAGTTVLFARGESTESRRAGLLQARSKLAGTRHPRARFARRLERMEERMAFGHDRRRRGTVLANSAA